VPIGQEKGRRWSGIYRNVTVVGDDADDLERRLSRGADVRESADCALAAKLLARQPLVNHDNTRPGARVAFGEGSPLDRAHAQRFEVSLSDVCEIRDGCGD
jgi:hypothetical protein